MGEIDLEDVKDALDNEGIDYTKSGNGPLSVSYEGCEFHVIPAEFSFIVNRVDAGGKRDAETADGVVYVMKNDLNY